MYYSIRNVFIISIFILVILTSIHKKNFFNHDDTNDNDKCKIMQYYMIITTPH